MRVPVPILLLRVTATIGTAIGCGGASGQTGAGSDVSSSDGDSGVEEALTPTIDGLEPGAGPFGTEVTLAGTALAGTEGFPARFATLEDGALTRCCVEPDDPAVIDWTDESVRLRWPFPYTGSPLIQTAGGIALAPTPFEPSWIPGPLLGADVGTSLFAHYAPELDAVAAIVMRDNGLRRIVVGPGGVRDDHYFLSTTALHAVSFHGELDGIGLFAAATYYGELAIFWIDFDPTALSWSQVDTAPLGDPLVAGTLSGAIPSVWAHGADGTLSRYVLADVYEDTWASDRGPIDVPDAAGVGHQAALLPSGELLLVWSSGTTPMGAILPPATDVLETPEVAAAPSPVPLTRTRVVVDATGSVLATWCPAGDGWGIGCVHAIRDSDGSWSQLETPGDDAQAVVAGLAGGTALLATCDDDGLQLATDAGASPEIAVWPCDPADPAILVTLDEGGRPAALVRTPNAELYFARQR